MSISIRIDASDFHQLADDLRAAADGLEAKLKPVVAKGALNIKTAMQADMAESGHFGQAASSISYDQNGLEAEIGPTKGSPGSIANIAYFGGAHGGGGSVRDPMEAGLDELPKFEQAALDILGDLLS